MSTSLQSKPTKPLFIRAYLRASTEEQDANRARDELDAFVKERGFAIASYYTENESGASLQRPELFRLFRDCMLGSTNILLVEQIDRLSRLTALDWETLRTEIKQRQIRVVALDLPTSWGLLTSSFDAEDFNSRMLQAINDMMLDMLAAIARKDYDDRRRRQAEGIKKAKDQGDFTGRVENIERNMDLMERLRRGDSWSSIMKATGCSSSTLSRLRSRMSDHTITFTVRKENADAMIKDMVRWSKFEEPLIAHEDLGRSLKVTIAKIDSQPKSNNQSET